MGNNHPYVSQNIADVTPINIGYVDNLPSGQFNLPQSYSVITKSGIKINDRKPTIDKGEFPIFVALTEKAVDRYDCIEFNIKYPIPKNGEPEPCEINFENMTNENQQSQQFSNKNQQFSNENQQFSKQTIKIEQGQTTCLMDNATVESCRFEGRCYAICQLKSGKYIVIDKNTKFPIDDISTISVFVYKITSENTRLSIMLYIVVFIILMCAIYYIVDHWLKNSKYMNGDPITSPYSMEDVLNIL
jgi:hypothetical protein